MAEERMSLADAAEVLGVAPNTVRSRWKAQKIRGERDNDLKIWVWVDRAKAVNDRGSKPVRSKGSKDGFEGFEDDISKGSKEAVSKGSKSDLEAFEIKALQNHLKTVLEQLGIAQNELAELRPKAEKAIRLEAENDGLRGQLSIRAEQLEELRRLLSEAKQSHADELRRVLDGHAAKGFFARLFAR